MGLLGLWHGTSVERKALNVAIEHHCECADESPNLCSAHSLLADERIMNHLVFVRRTAVAYETNEFSLARES